MSDLAQTGSIDDPENNRVEAVDRTTRRSLVRDARAAQFIVAEIDCGGIAETGYLFAVFADALRFPDWFGDNWDALADCLADLSWWPAPGYVLLIDDSAAWQGADAESFDTLYAILEDTADAWRTRGIPFLALFPLEQTASGTPTSPAAEP